MDENVNIKPCDCKGKRTCLLCEKLCDKKPRDFFNEYRSMDSYVYCIDCDQIYKGWDVFQSCRDHNSLQGSPAAGIFVLTNFLSSDEAQLLVDGVDNCLGWDASQSGRRKKNFGPKVNFKKKKLSVGTFKGFSPVTCFVRERFKDVQLLENFETVEECFLEYEESRGSHIEPHIDDCWIWGERVVTLNCLGSSVLTLTKHNALYPQQYNIDLVKEYEDHLIHALSETVDDVIIRIPQPEKSLMVLFGSPRYQFEHSVLREDIERRRVAICYREFTIPYQKNNLKFNEAEQIYKLCNAKN